MTTQAKTDHDILKDYFDTQDTIARLKESLYQQEKDIKQLMEERGDKAIADPEFICELKSSWQYDQDAFVSLKEILDEVTLQTVYTPAFSATVDYPEKWETTKVLALGRKYAQVQAVIDHARHPGAERLDMKRRETNLASKE